MHKIDIEKMWEIYAKTSLKNIEVSSIQYVESKRVFYAAVGITLVTIRDVLGSKSVTEEQGVASLHDMHTQVLKFFEKAIKEK
jgi:hypothetical protein